MRYEIKAYIGSGALKVLLPNIVGKHWYTYPFG